MLTQKSIPLARRSRQNSEQVQVSQDSRNWPLTVLFRLSLGRRSKFKRKHYHILDRTVSLGETPRRGGCRSLMYATSVVLTAYIFPRPDRLKEQRSQTQKKESN